MTHQAPAASAAEEPQSTAFSPTPTHTHVLPIPADAQRLTRTLTVRNGAQVRVRPIRPDDTQRLQAFHAGLSADTVLYRFFRHLPTLTDTMARNFTHLDYENRMALVATAGEGADERLIGVVRYERIGPDTAEVAFVIADDWQRQGISTALLRMLAEYARPRGIRSFEAITMPENTRMLAMLRQCGFPAHPRFLGGDMHVRIDIDADEVERASV